MTSRVRIAGRSGADAWSQTPGCDSSQHTCDAIGIKNSSVIPGTARIAGTTAGRAHAHAAADSTLGAYRSSRLLGLGGVTPWTVTRNPTY